jgi:hypothetical protein
VGFGDVYKRQPDTGEFAGNGSGIFIAEHGGHIFPDNSTIYIMDFKTIPVVFILLFEKITELLQIN